MKLPDTLAISDEYPTKMNTLDCINFPYTQQSKVHCQKCGRRSRSHTRHVNNRRVKSEHRRCRHTHLLKCNRQEQRLFPTELRPYPIITQTNDNHSRIKPISKTIRNRKSSQRNVIIDQLIQVQQLDVTRCTSRSHSYSYDMDNDYKKDEYQIFRDTMNKSDSNNLQRVQQMVYLRENINKYNHRYN